MVAANSQGTDADLEVYIVDQDNRGVLPLPLTSSAVSTLLPPAPSLVFTESLIGRTLDELLLTPMSDIAAGHEALDGWPPSTGAHPPPLTFPP